MTSAIQIHELSDSDQKLSSLAITQEDKLFKSSVDIV